MLFYLINKNTYTFACTPDVVACTVIAAFDHAGNSCNNRILNMNYFVCLFFNLKLQIMLISFKVFKIFLMRSNITYFYEISYNPVTVPYITDSSHCSKSAAHYFKLRFFTFFPFIYPVKNCFIFCRVIDTQIFINYCFF